MSTSERTPFSTIQERLQKLKEGTGLYIPEDQPLAPFKIKSEDSDNNSSRSRSEEEKTYLRKKTLLKIKHHQWLRQ